MKLDDARVWFRYRSKMKIRVKGNTSSAFRQNMDCKGTDLRPRLGRRTQPHGVLEKVNKKTKRHNKEQKARGQLENITG